MSMLGHIAETFMVCILSLAMVAPVRAEADYPRIANLWGYYPGGGDYDQWARRDLIVTAGGELEQWRTWRQELVKRNPDIILLESAPLMNIGKPEDTPWMKDEWYLRRPDGEKVYWWAGLIYAPNLMIDECLDALVAETVNKYGPMLAEKLADGLFYDSVIGKVSWYGPVDTDRDGQPDVPAEIDPRWQQRQNLFMDKIREKYPQAIILANDVDFEHAPHLHGRLFEGAPLLDRLADGSMSAPEVFKTLDQWMEKSLKPPVTFAIMTSTIGWQGWRIAPKRAKSTSGEVDRLRRDFARMRLGLCTTLMTDAYYAYDFGTVWYGMPWWYAEYDAPLGQPLSDARQVESRSPITVLDWRPGHDPVFNWSPSLPIDEDKLSVCIEDRNAGWRRLFGTDVDRLPLKAGKRYRIQADVRILTQPSNTLQFTVRTATGGWEHHDKGVRIYRPDDGEVWHIDVEVALDDYDDYSVEWHMIGAGAIELQSLHIHIMNEYYYRRDFENGIVLLNAMRRPMTIELDRPMRKLKDDAAPRYALTVDDTHADFDGAWQQLAGENHYYGPGYRQAGKTGSQATWALTAPDTDTYTISVCGPGGDAITSEAAYTLKGPQLERSVNVSQKRWDAGWVELFEVVLEKDRTYALILSSGGTGATVADAVHLESKARYNDGSEVRRVELGPLDGIILLKR